MGSESTSTTQAQDKSEESPFKHLRCGIYESITPARAVRVGVGDDIVNFSLLIERNSFYKRWKKDMFEGQLDFIQTYDQLLDQANTQQQQQQQQLQQQISQPLYYDVMFDLFMQPSIFILRILQEVTAGLTFDIYTHIRMNDEKKDELTKHVFLSLQAAFSSITELIQNKSSIAYSTTRPIRDHHAYKQFASTSLTSTTTVTTVQTSTDPATPASPTINPTAIRVYFSAAYASGSDWCVSLISRCHHSNYACTCTWFDPLIHAQLFGIPSLLPQQEKPLKGFDWGPHPRWVALVNLYMAKYVTYEIWTTPKTKFGQLLGVIAHMSISDFTAEHVQKKRKVKQEIWTF